MVAPFSHPERQRRACSPAGYQALLHPQRGRLRHRACPPGTTTSAPTGRSQPRFTARPLRCGWQDPPSYCPAGRPAWGLPGNGSARCRMYRLRGGEPVVHWSTGRRWKRKLILSADRCPDSRRFFCRISLLSAANFTLNFTAAFVILQMKGVDLMQINSLHL